MSDYGNLIKQIGEVTFSNPKVIIENELDVRGNVDLDSGSNIDVSSLSINNIEIIDASKNIKNVNQLTFTGLTSGSIPYINSSKTLTQNNSDLFYDATNSRLGVGTNTPSAKIHVVNTGTSDSFRVDDQTGDTTVFRIDNNGAVNVGEDSSINPSGTQFAIHSTYGGFLPPRFNQTQKLLISSPPEGLEVYDTTSKCKSYFNGSEWFVPSYSSFKLNVADTTPGVILWDSVTTSNDARISFNSGTGVFTFLDQGTYEIHCSANFYMTENEPERSVQILFVDNSTGNTHSLASTCITILLESLATFTNASINSILTISPSSSSTYRFNFSSSANNTIKLGVQTHGFIRRIL